MSNEIYNDLMREAEYALRSKSRDLVYLTYGKALMAWKLRAIGKTQFSILNTLLIRHGLNNPKAGLEAGECVIPDTKSIILPRCDVGDTLYFVLEDDIPEHRFYISEERVTEVCSKGFFISACFPAQDDLGEYFSWDSIGEEIFLTREEAEEALEMKGGIEDEMCSDKHTAEMVRADCKRQKDG